MVDSVGVKKAGASFNAVHGVALVKQELGQVGAVLAGNAGNEGGFVHVLGQGCYANFFTKSW